MARKINELSDMSTERLRDLIKTCTHSITVLSNRNILDDEQRNFIDELKSTKRRAERELEER